MNKIVFTFLITSLMTISAYGQKRQRRQKPDLSEEQKVCIEGILGVKGERERPTREQKRVAAQECGLEKPENNQDQDQDQDQEHGKQHFHEFTQEQEYCLEDLLGPRGVGERPSREQMQDAAEQCEIDTDM